MITVPKFRLGTIFLFFFCYAIGLSITRDALGALEPTIALAMLIGLGQEIRQLWRWTPPAPPQASFRFARRFAICWRCIVGLILFGSLAIDLARVAFPPSDPAGAASYNLLAHLSVVSGNFPGSLLVCILIVLCNGIERWRPKSLSTKRPTQRARWLAFLAAPILAIVVLRSLLLMYLTHWGLSNIEARQKPRFHRLGAYLTPVDQKLLPFWFGLLAIASFVAAAFLLLRFARYRNFARASFWNLMLAVPLLGIVVAFCRWYFKTELRILSPDLAEGGFEAFKADWFNGAALAATVAAAVAYKLAGSNGADGMSTIDDGDNPESVPFHQSVACAAVIGVHGVYGLFTLAQTVVTFARTSVSFASPFPYAWISLLYDPLTLILLAGSLASLQFGWIRWRHHNQAVPWQIRAVSHAAWFQGFFATLLLFAIGIPTLHAFTFICWLMPWNLKALFGY